MTIKLRRVAVLAATGIVLALLGSSASTTAAGAPTGTDVDGPDYPRPTVGECRNYGMRTVNSPADGSQAIACTQTHTALVVSVVDLPDDLSWADEDADAEAFYAKLLSSGALVPCATASRKALGASYPKIARTAYSWTFYRPTDTQVEHGARWIRCDVNLFGGKRLQTLPRGASVTIGTISKAEQACRLWTGETAVPTGCSSKHHYRVVKLVKIPGSKLPSNNRMLKLAAKKCAKATGPNWWANWPGQASWADGDRVLACSRPTRR